MTLKTNRRATAAALILIAMTGGAAYAQQTPPMPPQGPTALTAQAAVQPIPMAKPPLPQADTSVPKDVGANQTAGYQPGIFKQDLVNWELERRLKLRQIDEATLEAILASKRLETVQSQRAMSKLDIDDAMVSPTHASLPPLPPGAQQPSQNTKGVQSPEEPKIVSPVDRGFSIIGVRFPNTAPAEVIVSNHGETIAKNVGEKLPNGSIIKQIDLASISVTDTSGKKTIMPIE